MKPTFPQTPDFVHKVSTSPDPVPLPRVHRGRDKTQHPLRITPGRGVGVGLDGEVETQGVTEKEEVISEWVGRWGLTEWRGRR